MKNMASSFISKTRSVRSTAGAIQAELAMDEIAIDGDIKSKDFCDTNAMDEWAGVK